MKKFIAVLILLALSIVFVERSFSGSLEDIRKKVGRVEKGEGKGEEGAKGTIKIQSLSKGVVSGWVFNEGAGTRMVRSIDVKFKVSRRGQVELPFLYCYLFDREKKELKKLSDYLVLTPSGSQEPVARNIFTGGKTCTVQFVYPNDLNFKYYLAVVGNDSDGVHAIVMPKGATLDSFDFPEKKLIVKDKNGKKEQKQEKKEQKNVTQ